MRAYRGNGYRVLFDVVREPDSNQAPETQVLMARCIVRHFRALQRVGLVPNGREAFCAVLLDSRHRTIGFHVISIGTLNSSSVHPREVFRAAIMIGAAAMVVGHNHPSGDCTPSGEDQRVTERLREVGQLVGIEMLDHVVIGSTRFYSFASGQQEAIE